MSRRRRAALTDIVRYPYMNPDRPSETLFWKVRARTNDRRRKTFWYLTPDPEFTHASAWFLAQRGAGKPQGAERALFLIRHVYLAKKHAARFVIWTEGEKDAMACRVTDWGAVSHHGGAGKATEQQAEHFKGYKGSVLIVVDRDDPGYYDGLRRKRLLDDRGVANFVLRPADGVVPPGVCPPGAVCRCAEICPPDDELWRGVDLSDHLAAGYGLADLVEVEESDLRTAADRWAARQQQGAVYGGFSDPLLTPEFTAELHELASRWPERGWPSSVRRES